MGRRSWTEFGMTPFHVLFSNAKPSKDLLQVLLEKNPYHILDNDDAIDNLAIDYLVSNWTESSASLLQKTLQRWMLDPIGRWGASSWMKDLQCKVQAILAEGDEEEGVNSVQCSAFCLESL